MRDDDPALGDLRGTFGQYRRDVFIRQPVKSVASHTLVVECVWQCEGLLKLGCGAVKGGVKTRDLEEFGINLHRCPDRREIVRFV